MKLILSTIAVALGLSASAQWSSDINVDVIDGTTRAVTTSESGLVIKTFHDLQMPQIYDIGFRQAVPCTTPQLTVAVLVADAWHVHTVSLNQSTSGWAYTDEPTSGGLFQDLLMGTKYELKYQDGCRVVRNKGTLRGFKSALNRASIQYLDMNLECGDARACNYMRGGRNDEVCEYESCFGCLDKTACNYDPSMTKGRASDCDYSCVGCRDEAACNYDSTATKGNPRTRCDYPAKGYDCDGNCLVDTNDNGICDGDEVSGCMDKAACNYESKATLSTRSCDYPRSGYDCAGNKLIPCTAVIRGGFSAEAPPAIFVVLHNGQRHEASVKAVKRNKLVITFGVPSNTNFKIKFEDGKNAGARLTQARAADFYNYNNGGFRVFAYSFKR